MIEVHLYGGLRRHAAQAGPHQASVAWVDLPEGTVAQALARLHIERSAVSNVFVNGRYDAAPWERRVRSGDRVGVFPADMRLLYV